MSVEARANDGRAVRSGETVAAVDEVDGRPHLVVADITRDEAWLAVDRPDAVDLDEWV